MAAPKGWVYDIDGLDLNDWDHWITDSLPEVENGPSFEPRRVEMQDDFPVVVGSDPQEARWTLNVLAVEQHPDGSGRPVLAISDTTWQLRLAELEAVLTKGSHTLTVKARGMSTEKSVLVWYESKAVAYKERRISVVLSVPKPVLQ